jgi:hypothetical protein
MGTDTAGRRIPPSAMPVAGSRSIVAAPASGIVTLSRGAIGGGICRRTHSASAFRLARRMKRCGPSLLGGFPQPRSGAGTLGSGEEFPSRN